MDNTIRLLQALGLGCGLDCPCVHNFAGSLNLNQLNSIKRIALNEARKLVDAVSNRPMLEPAPAKDGDTNYRLVQVAGMSGDSAHQFAQSLSEPQKNLLALMVMEKTERIPDKLSAIAEVEERANQETEQDIGLSFDDLLAEFERAMGGEDTHDLGPSSSKSRHIFISRLRPFGRA